MKISQTSKLKIPLSDFNKKYVNYAGYCRKCGLEHTLSAASNRTTKCIGCGANHVRPIDMLFIDKMIDTDGWAEEMKSIMRTKGVQL